MVLQRSTPKFRAALGVLVLVCSVLLGGGSASADHAVARWSGADRVETAIEVSRQAFDAAPVVVIANQAAFADALAAGPMAGSLAAPVLLSPGDRLQGSVRAELDRLGPDLVFLMGGRAALSSGLEAEIRAAGFEVQRISGPNRYATAAAAAVKATEAWIDGGDGAAGRRVVIALGNHIDASRAWPDALAAGVAAGLGHEPLLLVEPARVPIETRDAIVDLGATSAVVVGGRAAIPDETADMLGIPWTRVSGSDRYATAVKLAERAVANGASSSSLTIVTGRAFPDALGAVPAAIARGSALLLVDGQDLEASSASQQWLNSLRGTVTDVAVVGGRKAVSDLVVDQIANAVDGVQELRLSLEHVVDAAQPLALRADASAPDIFYVAERQGRVLRVDVSGDAPVSTTFLDIRDLVSTNGERGLLDIILHPQFATNGRFYVHYSAADDGRTVLAEYRRGSNPAVADTAGAVLYEVDQPASNHNGGGMAFLLDGTLLLALGDGGGSDDVFGTGQNPNSALGSLLRFEVPSFGVARAPADNPYVDGPGVDEIWARGLRNPYRISVDEPSGTLWVADVGQDKFEEVNAVAWNAGNVDYGWSTMEGPDCFRGTTCDRSGLTLPVHSYPHGSGGICSVTGGYVHRGSISGLRGHYVFGDFCSGDIWSLRLSGGQAVDVRSWPELDIGLVFSFGTDSRGETYVMGSGTVWRIVAA